MSDSPDFSYGPSADHPGWFTWDLTDTSLFNGQVMGNLIVRREDGGRCRLRMFTARKHANLSGAIHGGITLSLMDVALFAAFRTLSNGDGSGSVTLELSSQFIGAGRPGEPLDAVVEVLRETGRLVFLRGTIEQGEAGQGEAGTHLVASFSGIVRKPPRK